MSAASASDSDGLAAELEAQLNSAPPSPDRRWGVWWREGGPGRMDGGVAQAVSTPTLHRALS